MGRRGRWWDPNPETMLEDLIALARKARRPGHHELAAYGRLAGAATKAARKRRSEAASARRADAQRAARRAKRKPRIVDRLLACMEPGKWYGRGDVTAAAGLERLARGKFLQALLPRKLVERRKNPDWRPDRIWTPNEPRWLYRLTPAGESLREAVSLAD